MIINIPGSSPYGFRLDSGDGKVVTVARVRKESKAQQAGLREGDVILAINGISCSGLSYDSVYNLTGLNDHEVNLTVSRSGTVEPPCKTTCKHDLIDEPYKYRNSYISNEQFSLNDFQRQQTNCKEFINQPLPKIYIAANEDKTGKHFFSRSFVSLEKNSLYPFAGFKPNQDRNRAKSENVNLDAINGFIAAKRIDTKSGKENYNNDFTTTFALMHTGDSNKFIHFTPYAEQNVCFVSKASDNIPEEFQNKSLAIMQQTHPTWTCKATNELISNDTINPFYSQPQNKLVSGSIEQKPYETLKNPITPKLMPSNILKKYDIGNLRDDFSPHENSKSSILPGSLKNKHNHLEQSDAFKLPGLYTNLRSENVPVQVIHHAENNIYQEHAPPPPPPLNLLNGNCATRNFLPETNFSKDEFKAISNVKDINKENLDDKVKKAKDMAQSVLSPANKNSRGQKMFLKRRANSENWIVKDTRIENSFSVPYLSSKAQPKFSQANREFSFWKPPSQPFSQAKAFSELTLGYCDL